jgi:outer membrane murein-binding lipoprotein Lpp
MTAIKRKWRLLAGIAVLVATVLILPGCAELMKVIQTASAVKELTEADIIGGLKEALTVGARNAAGKLAAENGYYSDPAVKIPLPDEAGIIIDNISKIPGGQQLIENVVLSINRAAEDAAREVAPVFVNSVLQMTITDGYNILHGADNAATAYLRSTTQEELYNLYRPKISASTDKDIVAGVSAQESWTTLTDKWNSVANSVAGKVAGFKPVNTDLDDFLTRKALEGVFLRMEGEELRIRKEVEARVTPLLRKVFGTLDQQ